MIWFLNAKKQRPLAELFLIKQCFPSYLDFYRVSQKKSTIKFPPLLLFLLRHVFLLNAKRGRTSTQNV